MRRREATEGKSANGEDTPHARGGVSRHGAEVAVAALLLEGDGELRRLARLDQRSLLAVDLEVVQHVARVLEREPGSARPRERLLGELERELLPAHADPGRARMRMARAARGGELNQRERRDRECRKYGGRVDGELPHLRDLLRVGRWRGIGSF